MNRPYRSIMKLRNLAMLPTKEPSIVPANDDADEGRTSGIFVKRGPSPASICEAARTVVASGSIAVLLAATVNRGPSAHALVKRPPADDLGFPLELRLAAWLTSQLDPSALEVPAYLKPWLPFARAAVVPMRTPCWTAGYIVVALDGLTRADVRALEELATDFAVEIETRDRRDRVAELRSLRP